MHPYDPVNASIAVKMGFRVLSINLASLISDSWLFPPNKKISIAAGKMISISVSKKVLQRIDLPFLEIG